MFVYVVRVFSRLLNRNQKGRNGVSSCHDEPIHRLEGEIGGRRFGTEERGQRLHEDIGGKSKVKL